MSLLHGVWAEVRTLVVGEVQSPKEKHGEQVIHTQKLSYFSRKVNAETFCRLALVEIHRRGIENAKELAALMDDAEWVQGFTEHYCPKATRILDFPLLSPPTPKTIRPNPWRNFKFGKALYQRKPSPKL